MCIYAHTHSHTQKNAQNICISNIQIKNQNIASSLNTHCPLNLSNHLDFVIIISCYCLLFHCYTTFPKQYNFKPHGLARHVSGFYSLALC